MENNDHRIVKVPVVNVKPDGGNFDGFETVLREHELVIHVNGAFFGRLLCTDRDLRELCFGHLYSSGVIVSASDVTELKLTENENMTEVSLIAAGDASAKEKKPDDPGKDPFEKTNGISTSKAVLPEQVFELCGRFRLDDGIHSKTAGTHTAILMHDAKIVFITEDISRHNTIDKAVGHMLLNGIPAKECILFTSGRVQSDVVEKVEKAGIPVLISKSVPTKEAADRAKEAGITLICRAFPDGYQRFT